MRSSATSIVGENIFRITLDSTIFYYTPLTQPSCTQILSVLSLLIRIKCPVTSRCLYVTH